MARPRPDPFMQSAMTASSLLERPAQPRDVLGGDAWAIVLDGEMDPLGDRGRAYRNQAALGRELHRVAHERCEHALDRQRSASTVTSAPTSDPDRDAFARAVGAMSSTARLTAWSARKHA